MAAAEDPLSQQSLRQEQLRGATVRVGAQLDQILTDFELNGISGEDVKLLRAIRSVIHRLSETEMQSVLAYLNQARQQPGTVGQSVGEAFSGQRSIITQLRQLLVEYQRQQAVYDIAIRMKELAARQTENMRLAVWLGRQVERKSVDQFQESQRLNLQLQETDEASLRAETAQVLEQLEKLVNQSADAPTMERPRKALQHATEVKLLKGMDGAVEELKGGRLLGAAGTEKRSRDLMREVARMLTQSLDKRDAIREALRELDLAIESHHKVVESTRLLKTAEDAAKREGDQAAVVDLCDLIRRDLQDLVPVAAEHLQGANDKMQDARGILMSGEAPLRVKEQALSLQADASAKLEQTRRELIDQLEKAEAPKGLPDKSLAAIDVLQQRVRELIKRQEALRKDADKTASDAMAKLAPVQGELKDLAQESQQQAGDLSPAAAEALGEAATQMNRLQRSFAEGKNQDPLHQAALDALSRAEKALAMDKERLEQADQALADLEALLKRLLVIIGEQQDLFKETTAAAVKAVLPDVAGIAAQQGRLGERTQALEADCRKPCAKAADFMVSAASLMNKAREQLAERAAVEAQTRESDALKSLYQARRELERKIKALQQELGEEPQDEESGTGMQEAADAIAQAQKDVNEALAQLQQGAANALQTLREKEQQIASDLAQPLIAAPQTLIAKREADASVGKLGKADLVAAIESMKAALSAMEQGVKINQPNVADGAPNLPAIRDAQKEVIALAQLMHGAMKNASSMAVAKAGEALSRASKRIKPLSAGKMGQLPPAAQTHIEAAQEDLDSGAAEAGEMNGQGAQASAQKAGQHLAQAQAALSLAQSGLSSDNQQAASNSQGQGKQAGQGRTKRSQKGQPGPQGDGREGNWQGQGTGGEGAGAGSTGSSRFTGLPARDRAAIQQSQSETYPQEYAPLVEQYLKNLADQTDPK